MARAPLARGSGSRSTGCSSVYRAAFLVVVSLLVYSGAQETRSAFHRTSDPAEILPRPQRRMLNDNFLDVSNLPTDYIPPLLTLHSSSVHHNVNTSEQSKSSRRQ